MGYLKLEDSWHNYYKDYCNLEIQIYLRLTAWVVFWVFIQNSAKGNFSDHHNSANCAHRYSATVLCSHLTNSFVMKITSNLPGLVFPFLMNKYLRQKIIKIQGL